MWLKLCFTDDACQDCVRNNLLFQDREIIQGAGERSFLTGWLQGCTQWQLQVSNWILFIKFPRLTGHSFCKFKYFNCLYSSFLFTYSFMWSYEKIHRCIAHLFLGELVSTFDEEFRILFAQSEPLVIDPSDGALVLSDPSSYLGNQFGLKRSQSLRNPIGYRRQPEIPSAFPYGDSDRNLAIPFRRNDPFRHTIEPGPGITIGKYSQQQFRLQQSYLDQGRSIVSRQMEISASGFKRHSYAEGTQESYTSSRQYMKHRVMNNLDETDFHR